MTIEGWSAEAFNQVPDSQNEIHGDRVSKLYGFEGGLVPGVTVSAYLLHPGVVAWGRDFLDRGRSHVRVISPLYDGERFEVSVADVSADSYRAELRRPGDVLCATAEVSLPDAPPPAPRRRGDPVEEETWQGPAATREHWAELQANGCRALRFRWDHTHRMARYLRAEAEGMPALLTGEAPCANTAYVLGVSNWVLAANGYMNPWVHLETTCAALSRHRRGHHPRCGNGRCRFLRAQGPSVRGRHRHALRRGCGRGRQRGPREHRPARDLPASGYVAAR